jgi:hypothetical protein
LSQTDDGRRASVESLRATSERDVLLREGLTDRKSVV